jgi:hypothetical protein
MMSPVTNVSSRNDLNGTTCPTSFTGFKKETRPDLVFHFLLSRDKNLTQHRLTIFSRHTYTVLAAMKTLLLVLALYLSAVLKQKAVAFDLRSSPSSQKRSLSVLRSAFSTSTTCCRASANDSSSRVARNRRPLTQRRDTSHRSTRDRQKATTTERAPHQFDHTKEIARPFVDAITELQSQYSNEGAQAYDYHSLTDLKCLATLADASEAKQVETHFERFALDDLFPNLNFSRQFASSTTFRTSIRNAIRQDIFDTTEMYASMSEKARKMLLLPDSSLQGSWRCNGDNWMRMKTLTRVLKEHLGSQGPTGDEFMEKIGELCGSQPSTHWIDIVGITGRKILHSWHQDTGRSGLDGSAKTVMIGFPREDNYDGVGVFSHAIKLTREQWAADDHPLNEPLVYTGQVDEAFIVRPRYAEGQEILVYRDIDILHSAPEITWRSSVMRFM